MTRSLLTQDSQVAKKVFLPVNHQRFRKRKDSEGLFLLRIY